jgi:xanthine dehydrogenase accessory factor
MEPINLKKLNAARRDRVAAVLVSELAEGRDRVVREGDAIAGELGEAISKVFLSGKSSLATVDGVEFFLNVHVPPPRIVVIGAVHISQALAPIAAIAGYALEIIDPRTAFATPERFANVTLHADWPQEVLAKKPLDSYTALVAVTHDPKIDDFPIQAAIAAKCFYVGALGSRKTHSKRIDRFLDAGFSEVEIGRIRAPIGYDIGAASPAEIAVAIMAQIIGTFRTRELTS